LYVHNTAYQQALTFRLLQPTNEQTAKACILFWHGLVAGTVDNPIRNRVLPGWRLCPRAACRPGRE